MSMHLCVLDPIPSMSASNFSSHRVNEIYRSITQSISANNFVHN